MSEVSDMLDSLAMELIDSARLEKAGMMASGFIASHIASGEGLDPLSPATSAYRGAGAKPLQDTGSLRDSITYELTGRDTVSVGTNKPYAEIQNNGGVITARKNWLFIPAAGTRKLQRKYGHTPSQVLSGLKSSGFSVFRKGRTVCYRERGKNKTAHVAYYLKKTVTIPARRFFHLTDSETEQIIEEIFPEV